MKGTGSDSNKSWVDSRSTNISQGPDMRDVEVDEDEGFELLFSSGEITWYWKRNRVHLRKVVLKAG